MNTNRKPTKNESLMATALLATAFVVTNVRSRNHADQPMHRNRHVANELPVSTTQTSGLLPRLNAAIDRNVVAIFHCAIPSGLEPRDFDLNDLTQE